MLSYAELRTVVVIQPFAPREGEWSEQWPDSIERRCLQRDVANGKALLVVFQLYAEFVEDGDVSRVGGTKWGPMAVRLDKDPTTELTGAAYEGRRHMGDLYGDLSGVRKWDLYAAPFRLELDDRVGARIRAAAGGDA
jgi:hypothetical protein